MKSDVFVPLTPPGISVTVNTGSERHASPCFMVQVVGIKQQMTAPCLLSYSNSFSSFFRITRGRRQAPLKQKATRLPRHEELPM